MRDTNSQPYEVTVAVRQANWFHGYFKRTLAKRLAAKERQQ